MKLFGKKEGATRSGGGGDGSAPNRGLIWGAWLLSTAGFGILLGGVASMQQVRGNSGGVGVLSARLPGRLRERFSAACNMVVRRYQQLPVNPLCFARAAAAAPPTCPTLAGLWATWLL